MNKEKFKEEVFEIAFGDNSINKGYSEKEVLDKLKEFSDHNLKYEQGYNILMDYFDCLPDDEKGQIDIKLTELDL